MIDLNIYKEKIEAIRERAASIHSSVNQWYDKGRTRAERAGEKYYSGIRTTPYASFVKMADRFANMSYSVRNGQRMAEVYRSEMPHFLESVVVGGTDPGSWYHVPASLLEAVGQLG